MPQFVFFWFCGLGLWFRVRVSGFHGVFELGVMCRGFSDDVQFGTIWGLTAGGR